MVESATNSGKTFSFIATAIIWMQYSNKKRGLIFSPSVELARRDALIAGKLIDSKVSIYLFTTELNDEGKPEKRTYKYNVVSGKLEQIKGNDPEKKRKKAIKNGLS